MIGVDGPSVHLWRAALDVDDSTAAALAVTLSPDELAQSARLRRPQDRRRSLVAHGVRRQILGAYLDRRPDTLRYRRGLHGKPEVDEPEASAGLEFSVSRSADLALYAVARERRVGVDVEALRPNFDWQPVAARYQTPAERATLEALPAERRLTAFFEWWTRKEAYVKACGEGLGAGEDRLSSEPDGQWSIVTLDVARGFAAALAVEGHGVRVVRYDWSMVPQAQAQPVGGNPRKFVADEWMNATEDSGGQARTSMRSGWMR